jgi:NTE family protein
VPVHVVATELKSGRATILSSGLAVPALLASCAIPGVFPPVSIGRREYVDGGVANHTPVSVAIELGATKIFVLPVGYPWLNREPTSALGMALHALARIVEQKLDADVAAHRGVAEIHVLPSLDLADVSPADFSHTKELIDWGYRSCRRYLSAATNGRGVMPEKARRTLRLNPAEAA